MYVLYSHFTGLSDERWNASAGNSKSKIYSGSIVRSVVANDRTSGVRCSVTFDKGDQLIWLDWTGLNNRCGGLNWTSFREKQADIWSTVLSALLKSSFFRSFLTTRHRASDPRVDTSSNASWLISCLVIGSLLRLWTCRSGQVGRLVNGVARNFVLRLATLERNNRLSEVELGKPRHCFRKRPSQAQA